MDTYSVQRFPLNFEVNPVGSTEQTAAKEGMLIIFLILLTKFFKNMEP